VLSLLISGIAPVITRLASSGASAQFAGGPNVDIGLSDVDGSFSDFVYVPVYVKHGTPFANLAQVISFDQTILGFNGAVTDVASQNVSFSFANLAPGVAKVIGMGTFSVKFNTTTLYYMNFTSLVRRQTSTEVTLGFSILGGVTYETQASSFVTLAAGWANIGPTSTVGQTLAGQTGAGEVSIVGYSRDLRTIYVGSGPGGPYGGTTLGAQAASNVYGHGGIFRSTDFGSTWKAADMGLNSTVVTSMVVKADSPSVVVLATAGTSDTVGGALYKSTNGGVSWQETYPIGGNAVFSAGGLLYAASFYSLLESSDFGSTWHVVHSFNGVVTSAAVANGGRHSTSDWHSRARPG